MAFEKTNFSHVYVKIYSLSLDRFLIYQATGSGVYFIGEMAFVDKSTVVKEVPFLISNETKVSLLRWAIDNSGKPYGYLQLLDIFLNKMLTKLGISIKLPFLNGNSKYICSELVLSALKEMKLSEKKVTDLSDLSEVYDLVSSLEVNK